MLALLLFWILFNAQQKPYHYFVNIPYINSLKTRGECVGNSSGYLCVGCWQGSVAGLQRCLALI